MCACKISHELRPKQAPQEFTPIMSRLPPAVVVIIRAKISLLAEVVKPRGQITVVTKLATYDNMVSEFHCHSQLF